MASFWSKLKDQIIPWDGGKSWSNQNVKPQPARAPSVQASSQNVIKSSPMQISAISKLSTPSMRVPTFNAPKINMPTISSNPIARVANTLHNDIVQPIKRDVVAPVSHAVGNIVTAGVTPGGAANPLGLGVQRSLIGTAQAASGLYDLASPGTGTNRFSQYLNKQALSTDKQGAASIHPNLYKAGQLVGDLATFNMAGRAAKAVGVIPRVSRVVAPVSRVIAPVENAVARTVAPLAEKGFGGRVVAGAAKNIANPAYQGANAAYTALQVGKDASRGTKITPQNVAIQNTIGGVGFPVAGSLGKEVVAPVVKAGENAIRSTGLIAPSRLNPTEVMHLGNFMDARGTRAMTNDVYNKGIAAAQKAGVDTNNVAAVDQLLGAHRTFETQKAQRAASIQGLKTQAKAMLPQNERGSAPLNSPLMPLNKIVAKGAAKQPETILFNGKPHEVVQTIKSGNDTKYQLRDSKGNEIWTNQAGLDTARKTPKNSTVPQDLVQKDVSTAKPQQVLDQSVPQQPLPSQAPLETPKNLSGNVSSVDNVTPLGKNVERIINNGAQVKDKSLNARLANQDKYPQGVKDMLSGTYVEQTNAQTIKDAKALIYHDPQAAEIRALAPKNAVDVQIGAELFTKYTSEGNFAKAVDFVNAADSTTHGQMIQILSQYDRTTPQGAVKYAQAAIKNYNKVHANSPLELDTKTIEDIVKQAEAIQKMPQGKERNIASQTLMQTVDKLIPSTKTDKAITLWKAGLLTSPRTHLRNIVGNAVHGAAELAKDPIAAANDMLLKTKTGKRTLTATARGTISGAGEGLSVAKTIMQTGFDPSNDISKFDIHKVNWGTGPMGKAAKAYTNFVFNTLSVEDKVFYHSSFRRSMYDQAGAAAINVGKRGDRAFIQNLVDNPTADMLKNATQDASVAVFKDKNALSTAVQGFKKGLKKGGAVGNAAGELTMPFTGVPSSIAGQMLAYSPIGLGKGMFHDARLLRGKVTAKDVPALQRKASQEVGRGVVGSGILGLGAYLTSQGLMTGNAKDAAEADQWKLEGKQANSILIGGKWRSINSIGPEAMIMLAGSKVQNDPNSALGNIGKDFTNQTFLAGVQAPLNAINDPARYAGSYVPNQIASLIPNIVKDTSKAFDSTARETKVTKNMPATTLNTLKSGIPFLRNNLLPSRDVLGNPIKQEPTGVGAYIDLFNSKTPIKTPVVNELSRLFNVGSSATPSALGPDNTIYGNKVNLTPQQLNTLESTGGQQVRSQLDTLITTTDYKALDDSGKQKAIQDLVTKLQTGAKKDLFVQGGLTSSNKYATSKDAPKNPLERLGLYGSAIIHDPKNNIANVARGIFTTDRARKMTGNTLILERNNGLSTMDGGNTNAQVDHKVPLSLGGSNDKSNIQYLTTTDNQKKAQYEVQLGKRLANKEIDKAEAVRLMTEYNKKLTPVSPGVDISKINTTSPLDATTYSIVKDLYAKDNKTYENITNPKGNTVHLNSDGKWVSTGKTDLAKTKAKDTITAKYPKDVQDFYNLTKAEQSAYFAKDSATATKLYNQAKQMDGELVAQGASSKFGATKSTAKSSGTSSKKTASAKKATKSKLTFKPIATSTNSAMFALLKSAKIGKKS